MEDMLSKIIEMDQKASLLTEDAQKTKTQLEQEIVKAKESIYNDYIERARKRIDLNEKADLENAQKSIVEIKANTENLLKQLNDTYNQNGDVWVDAIVKKVLSSI